MIDLALQVGVHIFLHATVVLTIVWLIVKGGSALPAASKHAAWVAAFVVLMLLPLGYVWMPGWTYNVELDTRTNRSTYALPDAQALLQGSASEVPLGASSAETESSAQTSAKASTGNGGTAVQIDQLYETGMRWLAPGFLLIWAGGVALLLGRLGIGMQALWRWKQSSTEFDDDGLSARLAEELNLRRPVSVRYSRQARVPVVWGFFFPIVILPEEATEWSRGRLRSVLLHEMAHVKRSDALTHLISRVARAVFWTNPLVWWAATEATAVQERACDDAVLRSGVRSWEYAEQLLAVTKTLRRGPAPVDAVALDAGMRFKDRMRALLKSTSSRRTVSARELTLFVGLGALLVVLLSALQFRSGGETGTKFWIEAERVELPTAFSQGGENSASRGGFVTVTREAEDLGKPPRTDPVEYTFETERSGQHLIWARVRVQSDDHNSFWIQVDSTRWIRWNGIEPGERWHWVQVRDADQDGRPVAFDLGEGTHELKVGPREEGIDVDQFLVTDDWHYRPRSSKTGAPISGGSSGIWLEAEDGRLGPSFQVETAAKASKWRHIKAWPDARSLDSPPSSGHATYSFTVSEAGTYHVWGRVIAPSSGSDSFWLRIDGGEWIRWNNIREGRGWHWDQVHDADDQNTPAEFELGPGKHELTIGYRERGVELDRLFVTPNDGYRPRGTGRRTDESPSVSIPLALEDAVVTPPMVRESDASSDSSGEWLGVPDGPGNDPPDGGPGAATWTFSVPEAGQYVVWGEVTAPSRNDNSFFVRMDGGKKVAWHTPSRGESTDDWTWDPVSSRDGDDNTDPLIFTLKEGQHRLRIRNREDGTLLRNLRVTNVSALGPKFVQP